MPILGRKVDRKRSGRAVPRSFKLQRRRRRSDDSSEDGEGETTPGSLNNNKDKKNGMIHEEQDSVRSNDEDKFSTGEESFQDEDDDDDEDFSAGKVESDEENSGDDESDFSAESPKRANKKLRNIRGRRKVAAPAKKTTSRAVARNSRGRPKKNESSDEEEFQQDESSEERETMQGEESSEDEGGKRGSRGRMPTSRAAKSRAGGREANYKTPPSKAASRPNTRNKDESAEESHEEESSEEEIVNRSNKRRRAQTKMQAPKRGRPRSKIESNDESEDEKSGSDNISYPRTPNRRPQDNIPSSTGSRSKRASAQKAIAALANYNDYEEEEEDYVIPKSFRKNNEDDEEFEDNGNEDDEEEENEGDFELEEDDLKNNLQDREKGNVGLVNDDDIGSAEESEDNTTRPHQSPRLSLQHQSPSRAQKYSAFYDSDEDSEVDRKNSAFSPAMPSCPSKRDAITDEDLPKKHICFFSPDGRSRQCFALETLHKIATSTVCEQIRQDLSGRVVQTFLQPPHFRSAMSDDLLDQIASRFGRDALDLHGEYYKRKKEENSQVMHVDESEDDENDDQPSLRASNDFVEQVHNYVRSQMGSRDLYVCPLCFIYARRKYDVTAKDEPDPDADAEESDDALHEFYLEKNGSDPMEVLGHLDMTSYSDSFLTASSFCFSKAAAVKLHLREDHGVSTKNIEGNDLYSRFKMRTTDGLLQRFLKTRIGHVNQGEMQRYWFAGNNFDFVYLCSLVDEAAARVQHSANVRDEDRKEAEAFAERSKNFFDSFENLAVRLWDLISGPFRRTREDEELKGFLAEDAEDEADDSILAHRQLDLERERNGIGSFTREERERIATYKREERADQDEGDYFQDEEDLQDTDDNTEENTLIENNSTSSSEEDEWLGAIKRKRKAKSPKQNKSRRRQSRTSSGATTDETLQEDEESNELQSVSPSVRKRLVIMDEEED